MRTIYLDPTLEGAGHSAVCLYKDALINVAQGKTHHQPGLTIVTINLNSSHLSVWGNKDHLKQILDAPREQRGAVALRLFLFPLSTDDFTELLQERWEMGVRVGTQENQAAIRKALGL